MKKYITVFFSLLILSQISFSQKLEGYKYAVVETITYQSGNKDVFGISSTLRRYFEEKGFTVLSEDNSLWNQEAKNNTCLILFCFPFTTGASTVGFIIKNCKNEILFDEKSTSANWVNDLQDNYNRALKNC